MSNSGNQSLSCPKCQAKVAASSDLAGKRVRCPKCESTIKVPGFAAAKSDDDDWLELDEPLPSSQPKQPASKSKPASSKPATPKKPKTSSRQSLDKPSPKAKEKRSAKSKPDPVSPLSTPPASADSDDMNWLDQVSSSEELDAFGDLPDLNSPEFEQMQFPVQDASAEAKPSLAVPAAPSSANSEPAEVLDENAVVGEYRFSCPVCDSAHYAKPDRTGREIKCADCHSKIVIPPPPKAKPIFRPNMESAETFELRESVVRANTQESPFTKSADKLLREAEDTHIDEDLDEMYENPDVAGWFKKVFGVFVDPVAMVHASASAAALSLSLAIGFSFPEGAIQFIAAPSLGLIGGLVLSASSLAVLFGSSCNQEKISAWPMNAPVPWLKGGIRIAVAAFLTAIPGALLGALIAPLWTVLVITSVFALLPIALLSMFENRSMFNIYSAEVIKSLTRCKEEWGVAYFASGMAFLMLFFVLLNAGSAPSAVGKGVLFGISITACGLFVARVLGRLAYECGQAIEAPTDTPSDTGLPAES